MEKVKSFTRLEEIQELRKEVQEQYLKHAQDIWGSNLEASKKDFKCRKEYDKYRNKDRFLERLEGMEESIIADLNWYKEKYL